MMADEYEWEIDEEDVDDDLRDDEEDPATDAEVELAARVRNIENAQKAKEAQEKADSIRAAFLESLPENQRGIAAVGLAGAETPTAMKTHIKTVQSLLKITFEEEEKHEDDSNADEDDDKDNEFVPVGGGTPVVPLPPAEKRARELNERIAEGGKDANKAALASWLKDSPVFGETVKDW